MHRGTTSSTSNLKLDLFNKSRDYSNFYKPFFKEQNSMHTVKEKSLQIRGEAFFATSSNEVVRMKLNADGKGQFRQKKNEKPVRPSIANGNFFNTSSSIEQGEKISVGVRHSNLKVMQRSHSQKANKNHRLIEPTTPKQKKSSQLKSLASRVKYEVTKSITSSGGVVQGFGICTTQGIVKKCNEDRVSVILNVTKGDPNLHQMAASPYSYFSVFDGHGGADCANYLREKLHERILSDPMFPNNCPQAIKNGIFRVETDFLDMAANKDKIKDKSGSCLLTALFKSKTII